MQEVDFVLKRATFGEFVAFLRIEFFSILFDQDNLFALFFCIWCCPNALCNLYNILCSKIITQAGIKMYCLLNR